MAQTSFRFNPIWKASGWWRLDISWRTADADPAHFIDEWTGSIPVEPTTRFTNYSTPKIKLAGKNDAELIVSDRFTVKIDACAEVVALLNPANVSAEARLWWSADNITWVPILWGIIPLDDVTPTTLAIIGSTHIKTYEFMVEDGLSGLTNMEFANIGWLGWSAVALTTVYNKGYDLSTTGATMSDGSWRASVLPGNSTSSVRVIALTEYLDFFASIVFSERAQTVTAAPIIYGYDPANPITCPFVFQSPRADNSVATFAFSNLYIFYDMFFTGTEWSKEWRNWGEFLAEYCETFGFSISTANTLESGRWVRSLQLVNVTSGNGRQIGYSGVPLARKGPRYNRKRRSLTVTTRCFSGGAYVSDFHIGTGQEKKMTTHFRTIGNVDADRDWGVQGDARPNTLWNCLVGKDGSDYRIVNFVGYNGVVYPTLPDPFVERMWYSAPKGVSYSPYEGTALSQVMGLFYQQTLRRGKMTIEETRSGIVCTDGAVSHPGVWQPYAAMADDEFPSTSFVIKEIEIDPDANKVTIIKEEL